MSRGGDAAIIKALPRVAFADTNATSVAWTPCMNEIRELGPLSQDETVFVKRFADVIHDSKNKIFG